MRVKILSVFMISIMIFANVHIFADNNTLCADNFESYEEYAGGNWVGQTSLGNEKIPLFDMGRGNSAKIVSLSNK